MENYDVYIVAPIIKKSHEGSNRIEENIFRLHDGINKLMQTYKTKVDIYSLLNVKINFVSESRKCIDSSSCVIIIIPSEYMRDFMTLIVYTISKNKKLYVLLLGGETQISQTGLIADGYKDVIVDRIDSDISDYERFESFILSAINERKTENGKTS